MLKKSSRTFNKKTEFLTNTSITILTKKQKKGSKNYSIATCCITIRMVYNISFLEKHQFIIKYINLFVALSVIKRTNSAANDISISFLYFRFYIQNRTTNINFIVSTYQQLFNYVLS